MQTLKDIFLPLQLDTLRGWWVLLTVVVIIGSIIYAIVGYVVENKQNNNSKIQKSPQDKKRKKEKKPLMSIGAWFQSLFGEETKQQDPNNPQEEITSYTEEEITDLPANIDDYEEQLSEEELVPSVQGLPRWKKLLPMRNTEKNNVVENGDTQDQYDDILEIGEEPPVEQEDNNGDETTEILMTEETVNQIEHHNKTQIKWEEFQSDLDYLKKKQKWDDYESKLIAGLAQEPDHIHILEHLADFYMMDNQYKKALPLYKKLVEKQSENHVFLRKMAQGYLAMKDSEMAEVLLDRALVLNPETPKYAMNLVEVYYKTQRKDQALALMEEIVKRRPDNLSYRNALVNLYEEQGDDNKIIDAYEAMLLVDPTNVALKRKLLEARTKIS